MERSGKQSPAGLAHPFFFYILTIDGGNGIICMKQPLTLTASLNILQRIPIHMTALTDLYQ